MKLNPPIEGVVVVVVVVTSVVVAFGLVCGVKLNDPIGGVVVVVTSVVVAFGLGCGVKLNNPLEGVMFATSTVSVGLFWEAKLNPPNETDPEFEEFKLEKPLLPNTNFDVAIGDCFTFIFDDDLSPLASKSCK